MRKHKHKAKNTILWALFWMSICLLFVSGDMIFIYPVFTAVADILALIYIYVFTGVNYDVITKEF